MDPLVGVIVLCYNGVDLTLECLSSIYKQHYPNLDVMVIDNGSQDGTADIVRTAYPQVQVKNTGENLGYAGGNNIGMQIALEHGAEYLFLLNNDTRVYPDCISALVKAISAHSRVGIVGPMVYTWDRGRIISSAGGYIDWRQADAANTGAGEVDRARYPARLVDYINGCGLMVRRSAIERAGMLDQKYYMYYEETDWCQRVRRAGYEVRFIPEARMRHKAPIHSGELGPTTIYYQTRNRLLFFARYTQFSMKPFTLAHAIHGAFVGTLRNRKAGRYSHARAAQLALLHAFQGHWGRTDPGLWLGKSSGTALAYPTKSKLA